MSEKKKKKNRTEKLLRTTKRGREKVKRRISNRKKSITKGVRKSGSKRN